MKKILRCFCYGLSHFILTFFRAGDRLSKYKGKHSCDTIYILAGGPSLVNQNLDFLSNQIVIAVNGSFSALSNIHTKRLYWLLADPKRIKTLAQTNRSIFDAVFIFLTPNSSFVNPFNFCSSDYLVPAYKQRSFLSSNRLSVSYPPKLDKFSFSAGAGSSIFNAIELALYFDCSNIVLLGCDFTVLPNGPSHFINYDLGLAEGKSYSKEISLQFKSKIRPALQFYSALCAKYGVKIFNCSNITVDDISVRISPEVLPL